MGIWKMVRRVILILLIAGLAYGIHYAWYSFPIVSGYDAKYVCSCMYVGGRQEDSVRKDLAGFPFSLAGITVNKKDRSVTATVLGMASKKAIYREGLGCTLVNGLPEKELRAEVFNLPPVPTPLSQDLPWPQGEKFSDSISSGIDRKQLLDAVNWLYVDSASRKRKTRAVVVIYKGQLVAEKYAPGFDQHSRMLGWSMAKSFMGAMAGILVQQKKLDITAPVPLEPVARGRDPKNRITTENLLQQTSGIKFAEHYSSYSNVTNMLFNEKDMAAYTLSLEMGQTPGTRFYYSSGNSNILSMIIRKLAGNNYPSFLYQELFYKIGMNSVVMEPDPSGTLVGSSYIFATARDYARFGLLYLHDGMWNGARILPEGWVERSTRSPAVNRDQVYGYQFWLNGRDPKDSNRRVYPDAPADMFYADGFGGQDIYIIPSRNLVIVRLGLETIDENRFLANILRAVK